MALVTTNNASLLFNNRKLMKHHSSILFYETVYACKVLHRACDTGNAAGLQEVLQKFSDCLNKVVYRDKKSKFEQCWYGFVDFFRKGRGKRSKIPKGT